MSAKIKGYKWLPWAIAIAIVFAIGIIGSGYTNWYFLEPWTPASRLVTELAIDAFGAGTDYSTIVQDAAPYWKFRFTALGAILLTFVVGPSLWVYAEIKNQDSESGDVLKKGIVWYVGVIFVVASLQVVPTAIVKGIVFQNTWESAAQSETKDELRSDLMKLGYDALELYHLPNDFGGGSGNFLTIAGESNNSRPIKLADLESYSQLSRHSYVLAPVESDNVIRIHGVSDMGVDADFENADENGGKLQMTLEVKPPANFAFSEN